MIAASGFVIYDLLLVCETWRFGCYGGGLRLRRWLACCLLGGLSLRL